MLKDFRTFVMRGNVIDLAIALIIGVAFGAVVKSMVDDVLMPVIGLATGGIDFSNQFVLLKDGLKVPPPYASLAEAKAAGAVVMSYGVFLNTVITFLIIAGCVFLIVRALARMQRAPAPPAPDKKDCPFCRMPIPIGATRCPDCTSQLTAA